MKTEVFNNQNVLSIFSNIVRWRHATLTAEARVQQVVKRTVIVGVVRTLTTVKIVYVAHLQQVRRHVMTSSEVYLSRYTVVHFRRKLQVSEETVAEAGRETIQSPPHWRDKNTITSCSCSNQQPHPSTTTIPLHFPRTTPTHGGASLLKTSLTPPPFWGKPCGQTGAENYCIVTSRRQRQSLLSIATEIALVLFNDQWKRDFMRYTFDDFVMTSYILCDFLCMQNLDNYYRTSH